MVSGGVGLNPGLTHAPAARWVTGVAALLAAVAVLVPPGAAAEALAGPASARLPQVVQGFWIFKALLLLHAVLLYAAGRLDPASSSSGTGALLPGGLGTRPAAATRAPAVRWEVPLLAVLLAAAAGLRLYDLGNGLWYDEVRTLVEYARADLAYVLSTYDSKNQHLLYSLLAQGSIAAFGDTAWALRLPAMLLGVASLWAAWWFGRLVTDRREALLATAFLAFSYHHVWFSQNARGYTGLLLFTLLGSGLFLRLLADPAGAGWKGVLGYAAAMALAVMLHVTAAIVVAAHALVWLALRWRARRTRARVHGAPAPPAHAPPSGRAIWLPAAALLLAGTFSLQLWAVLLPQLIAKLLEPTMAGAAVAWKNPLWMLAETVRGLSAGVPGGLLALAAGAAIALAGTLSYARSSGIVTAVMLLPAVLTVVLLLALEHNLWPRFFFFSAGFGVLIVVRGLFAVARRTASDRHVAAGTAAALLLLFASASTLPGAYDPKQDFGAAREFVERERAAGDVVVTLDLSSYAFEHYPALDWIRVSGLAQLEAVEQRHARTWLIYIFPTRLAAQHPDIWARLQDSYSTAARFPGTLGGGEVVVMVRP